MARIKEKPTGPGVLPGAKLFLEDIEEIADLFGEALKEPKYDASNDAETKVVFGVDGTKFDSVDDLRNLRRTTRFTVLATRGSATVKFDSENSFQSYSTYGLSDEMEWALYGKLKLLFESRPYGRIDKISFVLRRLRPSDWIFLVLVIVNVPLLPSVPAEWRPIAIIVAVMFLGGLGGAISYSYGQLRRVCTLIPRPSKEKPKLLGEFLDPKTVAPALWVMVGMLLMWLIEKLSGGNARP